MADAALLLVLVRPVEMLDIGVLLQLLLREELLLAQVARQPKTNGNGLRSTFKIRIHIHFGWTQRDKGRACTRQHSTTPTPPPLLN